jgi:hypothetical protein
MTEEVQKKRSRRTVKHERAVVGASWDAIRAKRNQKPDARAAARQAAISKSKDAKKAAAAAKKAANPAVSDINTIFFFKHVLIEFSFLNNRVLNPRLASNNLRVSPLRLLPLLVKFCQSPTNYLFFIKINIKKQKNNSRNHIFIIINLGERVYLRYNDDRARCLNNPIIRFI